MEWHAICYKETKTAVVRRADYGITDAEWKYNCRIQCSGTHRPRVAEAMLLKGYEVLDELDWNDYIKSLDSSGDIPNDVYVSTKKVWDKWDRETPIY